MFERRSSVLRGLWKIQLILMNINLLKKMFSSRKKASQKALLQANSFAADTFLLRRVSEVTRYKLAALMMFVAGFGLLTLGSWVLNDFNFLTFTN